jgi:hypothetical protein
MDDRRAHFFTLVGELSNAARTAALRVVLRLDDGTEVAGVPVVPHADGQELDDTGYQDRVMIGDTEVALREVSAITVLRPEG